MSGFVYFLQSELGGPVKIGWAVDPKRRLATLQTANPFLLRLHAAVPGGLELEAQTQEALVDSSFRGEWFAASEEVELMRVQLVRELGSRWDRKIHVSAKAISPRRVENFLHAFRLQRMATAHMKRLQDELEGREPLSALIDELRASGALTPEMEAKAKPFRHRR